MWLVFFTSSECRYVHIFLTIYLSNHQNLILENETSVLSRISALTWSERVFLLPATNNAYTLWNYSIFKSCYVCCFLTSKAMHDFNFIMWTLTDHMLKPWSFLTTQYTFIFICHLSFSSYKSQPFHNI